MDNSAKISQIRTDYTLDTLDVGKVNDQPIAQFNHWLEQAIEADVPEPTVMHLATANKDGKPSGRILLLKGTNEEGFVFYTNYDSRKGQELAENPYGCITFFWQALQRQVRIEGIIEKVDPQLSEDYFKSRPRGSQISALVSPQSKEINSRDTLEQQVQAKTQELEGKDIPKPNHWGGYCLKPSQIEFWQGRASRLHDRLQYTKEGETWKIVRLAP
ncbi:MAG TPA: pyridoxamine 5'-phosphate oxidase [Microscillaceae bacterium]|nr:pyridoxamine 5'-phosphate oxidase [Microscillaceae bacterium]